MSHGDVTTWTCDTCGDTVQVSQGATPQGWRKFTDEDLDPVRAAGTDATERYEVCASCRANAKRALAPKNDRVRTIQAADHRPTRLHEEPAVPAGGAA